MTRRAKSPANFQPSSPPTVARNASLVTDTKNIPALQQQVLQRPNDYNAHLILVSALKNDAKRQTDLANARRAFSEAFPLSVDMWKEWLSDEERMASEDSERRAVVDLYRRAVADYYSIDLYKGLVEFAIDLHLDASDELDLDQVREILSAANLATGHDLSASHQVWNLIKDFEVRLLNNVTGKPREQQLKRVRQMWKLRLATPHRQHGETWSAYSAFEQEVDPNSYESNMVAMKPSYNTGVQEFDEREAFDRNLALDQSVWNVEAYVEWESRKSKEFQRIAVVYERILASNPLDAAMWNSYLEYLLSHIQISAVLESATLRAVRNCPWSADVWLHRAAFVGRQGADNVAAVFSKAINNEHLSAMFEEVLKLVKGKAEWHLRNKQHAAAALQEGLGYMHEAHAEADPYSRYQRFAARALASDVKDMALARPVYDVLVKKHSTESSLWMEYALAEVESGNVPKARSLMKQASVKSLDQPELVFETWLAIEREHGITDTLYEAMFRIRNRRRDLAKKMQELVEAETAVAVAVEQPVADVGHKRAAEEESERPAKRAKGEKKGKKTKELVAEVANVETPDVSKDVAADAVPVGEDPTTLYVSKLPLTVTQQDLQTLFSPYGAVKDIRIVKRATTAFAYVEFATSAEAHASLALDARELEGKRIGVHISNPRLGKAPEPVRADPKEIFIKNLPRSYTEDDVRALFSPHGHVTSARVLRFPDGLSRGLGFVDFESEEEANASLVLSGTLVEGRVIAVEHSDPTAKAKKPTRSIQPPQPPKPPKPQEPTQKSPEPAQPVTQFKPRAAVLGKGGRGGKRLALNRE